MEREDTELRLLLLLLLLLVAAVAPAIVVIVIVVAVVCFPPLLSAAAPPIEAAIPLRNSSVSPAAIPFPVGGGGGAGEWRPPPLLLSKPSSLPRPLPAPLAPVSCCRFCLFFVFLFRRSRVSFFSNPLSRERERESKESSALAPLGTKEKSTSDSLPSPSPPPALSLLSYRNRHQKHRRGVLAPGHEPAPRPGDAGPQGAVVGSSDARGEASAGGAAAAPEGEGAGHDAQGAQPGEVGLLLFGRECFFF